MLEREACEVLRALMCWIDGDPVMPETWLAMTTVDPRSQLQSLAAVRGDREAERSLRQALPRLGALGPRSVLAWLRAKGQLSPADHAQHHQASVWFRLVVRYAHD